MKLKTAILATVFALSSTLAMAQGAGGVAGGAAPVLETALLEQVPVVLAPIPA
jgi:hypothetical protein